MNRPVESGLSVVGRGPEAPAERAVGQDAAADRLARRRLTTEERRQQIVDAAAELFDKVGYSNTSMEDIAAVVGVAKPTLYHYFPGKDAVLLEIHEEFIDLLNRQHAERVAAELGPEQLLLEVMADILELMRTHRGHVRVFFEHHRELPPEARAASGSSGTPTTARSSRSSARAPRRASSSRSTPSWRRRRCSACATGPTSGTWTTCRSGRGTSRTASGASSCTAWGPSAPDGTFGAESPGVRRGAGRRSGERGRGRSPSRRRTSG